MVVAQTADRQRPCLFVRPEVPLAQQAEPTGTQARARVDRAEATTKRQVSFGGFAGRFSASAPAGTRAELSSCRKPSEYTVFDLRPFLLPNGKSHWHIAGKRCWWATQACILRTAPGGFRLRASAAFAKTQSSKKQLIYGWSSK